MHAIEGNVESVSYKPRDLLVGYHLHKDQYKLFRRYTLSTSISKKGFVLYLQLLNAVVQMNHK